ncbi:MAG: hypothetical protein MUP81_02290 [Dehalococcoidia bacterium]|nr:hypothetical protein [Dehalococcoidia bacterium]
MDRVNEKMALRELTEQEWNEIEFQRKFGYGEIVVCLEAGQPVRAKEGVKSTKF